MPSADSWKNHANTEISAKFASENIDLQAKEKLQL